jgi:hypothetical protein
MSRIADFSGQHIPRNFQAEIWLTRFGEMCLTEQNISEVEPSTRALNRPFRSSKMTETPSSAHR